MIANYAEKVKSTTTEGIKLLEGRVAEPEAKKPRVETIVKGLTIRGIIRWAMPDERRERMGQSFWWLLAVDRDPTEAINTVPCLHENTTAKIPVAKESIGME
jgi:hypothetical protein